ncbi:ABC transporter substrate-binding protein [Eubacterium oxidoreducens]|uniref:Branched-chain amino acid transport system substrate-binding protein n=1 Tax=Eubacterium oxidoreducens TaxID=1732 RepID=A0A1G6ADW5_EUBOX|nr:ABC transporter substrate-binding protein [Eubacterium oxidoreducens]SDB06599.1 branched-chain amino acid transport system substrate-binding protein [Eubacterium oxidoreducens]
MKRKYKQVLALCAATVLLGSMAGCTQPASPVSTEETTSGAQVVRVGFVYPKSGVYSSYGEYTEEITQYAINQVNEKGFQIDGKDAEIVLVTADSASDPKQAKKAATKLIQEKGVDIMITSKTADTTVPVSKVCEKNHVVCLSVDTPDEAWAVDSHQYSFHAGFDTQTELMTFLSAWEQTDNTNMRVGIMHQNDSEGAAIDTALPDFAEEYGYVAYDPGSYQAGQQDFSNIIENLKNQQVTILAGVMSNSDFQTFYQQLENNGYIGAIKVITIGKAALFKKDIEDLNLNGICTEIWWNGDFPTESSINGMKSSALAEEFTRLTGEEEVPSTAGYDYANIEILYNVLKEAQSLNTDKLIAAASELNVETVIGTVDYNEQHYSVQGLAYGQWVYDTINKDWNLNVISADFVEGLEADAGLDVLESFD